MEQKDPEKKMPSTAAKATNLSANVSELFIHLLEFEIHIKRKEKKRKRNG